MTHLPSNPVDNSVKHVIKRDNIGVNRGTKTIFTEVDVRCVNMRPDISAKATNKSLRSAKWIKKSLL